MTGPLLGEAAQQAATVAFLGDGVVAVNCPTCGQPRLGFDGSRGPVERATEATDTAKTKPYGDVEYADPGYQQDRKKRYPLETAKRVKAAWSYINQDDNAALYNSKQLNQVKAKIKAAAKKLGVTIADQAAEALVSGQLSFADIEALVRAAIQAKVNAAAGDGGYYWVCVLDLSGTDVVYSAGDSDLWQCSYTLTMGAAGNDGVVELGDAVEVARTYAPVMPDTDIDPAGNLPEPLEDALEGITEARDQVDGRLIEAKGTDANGGRIFRVQVIAYGDSKNLRRYPEAVLKDAVGLYEGAKAYDRHRTPEELRSSTITGLVGSYRNVEATATGVEADLHLLPSAVHAAEALDASLAAQAEGLPPLVGISHDVMATYRAVVAGGQRLQEATSIVSVNSADVVANPAAGGKVTRMVAGGVEPATNTPAGTSPDGQIATQGQESGMDLETMLATLKTATPDQLAAVGLAAAEKSTEAVTDTTTTVDGGQDKTGFVGKLMIRSAVEDAGLPVAVVESVTAALPDRITEADVTAQIMGLKSALGIAERAGLTPAVGNVQVTQESVDKKKTALDAFFAADYSKGYRSFREAFLDFTGRRPKAFDEDFNRVIMAESFGSGFSSAMARGTESLDSTSWNLVLGDSITRRMVADYNQPSLQTWRQVVSSMPPVNDFRTQRIERIGGYGTLPAVSQGQPYQPLVSPGNEEITYAISKRGGTEDITLEMIANDDIRSIQRIPARLGLAAAQTLFRFVWDMLPTNAAVTYDSVALFAAGHNNTDNPAVLGQSTLSVGRKKMRKQTAYGDTSDVLSIVPKFLVVPSDLEEIAFQLCTSAVAIPATPAGPTDTPNIHQGLVPITVDYYSDTN
ncbi:MAG: hypothetical protein JWR37_1208, partial [Mycobacterium sp.]|nr:hypothetical protein [Mycobacterium sp.]